MARKAENKVQFSKKQFLESKTFSLSEKDIINAILSDEAKYSMDEVKDTIIKFLTQEAK